MSTKKDKKNINSALVGMLTLSLILSCPSSIDAHLYNEKNACQSLRAAASVNGLKNPDQIFESEPVSEFGMEQDAESNLMVMAQEGRVGVSIPVWKDLYWCRQAEHLI